MRFFSIFFVSVDIFGWNHSCFLVFLLVAVSVGWYFLKEKMRRGKDIHKTSFFPSSTFPQLAEKAIETVWQLAEKTTGKKMFFLKAFY